MISARRSGSRRRGRTGSGRRRPSCTGGPTGRRSRRRPGRAPAPAACAPRSRRRTRRPSPPTPLTCCGGERRGGEQAEPVAERRKPENRPQPPERPDLQHGAQRRGARSAPDAHRRAAGSPRGPIHSGTAHPTCCSVAGTAVLPSPAATYHCRRDRGQVRATSRPGAQSRRRRPFTIGTGSCAQVAIVCPCNRRQTAASAARSVRRRDRRPRPAVRGRRPRRLRRQRGRAGRPRRRQADPGRQQVGTQPRTARAACSTGRAGTASWRSPCPRRSGWSAPVPATTSWSRTRRPTGRAIRDAGHRRRTGRRDHDHGRLDRTARLHRRGGAARRSARRSGSASTSTPPGSRSAAGCTSAYAARRCTRPTRPARSPRRSPARPGFRLVAVMSYEAQIAGLGDAPPGQAAARRRASGPCSAARCRS